MRISDWSSDVCSSDLCTRDPRAAGRERGSYRPGARRCEPVGMIIPPGPLKVMVATKPVDFRKGAVSLAALVEHDIGLKPFSGVVFIFRSKRANRIKLLVWDGTGLVLGSKVLQTGGFH